MAQKVKVIQIGQAIYLRLSLSLQDI